MNCEVGKSLPFKGEFISRYFHVPLQCFARVETSIVTHNGDLYGFDAISDEGKSYIIRLIETGFYKKCGGNTTV